MQFGFNQSKVSEEISSEKVDDANNDPDAEAYDR